MKPKEEEVLPKSQPTRFSAAIGLPGKVHSTPALQPQLADLKDLFWYNPHSPLCDRMST